MKDTSSNSLNQPMYRAVMYRAMMARDKRFDGRIYIGVRTTGIYCRPICPARPLQKNIIFYKSQAEAERAGFRPCLRCRPDIAPGTHMWEGTGAIVGRALRILDQDENKSVVKLSQQLGLSARHVRRLFDEHLGASPQDIINSKRLHMARQLLSQTRLSITEIAFASGFNSIRRFNDSFKMNYKRAPSDFRKKQSIEVQAEDDICLYIPFREPYDWKALYDFLQSHAIAGVEDFDKGKYSRHIEIEGRYVYVEVSCDTKVPQLLVKVRGAKVVHLRSIISLVKHVFDIDHNPNVSLKRSKKRTSRKIPNNFEGIRIPGAFSGFETAVAIVLGQVVSEKRMQVLIKQLVELYGEKIKSPKGRLTHIFPSPKVLAEADLTPLKLPRTRMNAIRELSRKVANRELDLSHASHPEKTREQLLQTSGIGPWTVEMIAMRCLGDTNAFPGNDLIIQRAVTLLGIEIQNWEPWRAYLAIWIWKHFAKSS